MWADNPAPQWPSGFFGGRHQPLRYFGRSDIPTDKGDFGTGRKGGEVTSERHGPRFYEEIGRTGGQKVKRLIEQGKRAG